MKYKNTLPRCKLFQLLIFLELLTKVSQLSEKPTWLSRVFAALPGSLFLGSRWVGWENIPPSPPFLPAIFISSFCWCLFAYFLFAGLYLPLTSPLLSFWSENFSENGHLLNIHWVLLHLLLLLPLLFLGRPISSDYPFTSLALQRESSFTVPPFAVPFPSSVMIIIIHQFFSHVINVKTQYQIFETNIPRKEIAQPQSQFRY